MYIDKKTLSRALKKMYGTAGHLIKIWFTLKHMGLESGSTEVDIDTSNSTDSLKRLFSCGAPGGEFYVPFAHTPRYLTMKHDASRSIIQTTIQRWASSGSVVTCDPTEFLDISAGDGSKLKVRTGRRYPFGLGLGEAGFALGEGARVSIPIKSFAVWYFRKTEIPITSDTVDAGAYIVDAMLRELHISSVEKELIFVDEELLIGTQISCLTDSEIFSECQPFIKGGLDPSATVYHEEFSHYARRVKSMVSGLNQPTWMRTSPEDEMHELLTTGATAILLYGPPRTGKTRLIDSIFSRTSDSRSTIQIHDGWSYDHLVEGFKPNSEGKWEWDDGPLKQAVTSGKKTIVLEEINRTAISQALGEVFSLIEDAYRGEENAITLRSGKKFWIPKDIVFLMTMNTIDKSTEDIDDALLGRVAAVEFPARPEDLSQMLTANGLASKARDSLGQLFTEILNVYPLGHGYFANLKGTADSKQIVRYYKTRIRPVLFNFLGELKRQELAKIDNLVDEMFGKS